MIVLALVAQGPRVVVASHDAEHARFLSAAQTILHKIDADKAERLSYAFESWLFHYVAHDGYVYLAVADAELGRRIPFAFLTQLEKEVRLTHRRSHRRSTPPRPRQISRRASTRSVRSSTRRPNRTRFAAPRPSSGASRTCSRKTSRKS